LHVHTIEVYGKKNGLVTNIFVFDRGNKISTDLEQHEGETILILG